jgi:putative ATPase
VDAAIYYLAKLCASGDLEGLIRRLMVTAYEDVGLANPSAVDRCYHACQVAREVGFPEAIIPLSFTVCDLTLSPKSKSAALAIEDAMEEIDKHPSQVRDYLKLTPVNVQEEDKYPYDRPDLWEYIEYLPEGLEKKKFYKPWLNGNYEKNLYLNYQRLEKTIRSTSLRLLKEKKK